MKSKYPVLFLLQYICNSFENMDNVPNFVNTANIAVQKYPDVYWIETTNTVDGTHEWTSDGSHPSGYGYHLMAKSLLEPLPAILNKIL